MTLMTPLECVELQFEAYNQRDLPCFLGAFADDVGSYRLPDMTPLLDGKAAYGEFYARACAPNCSTAWSSATRSSTTN